MCLFVFLISPFMTLFEISVKMGDKLGKAGLKEFGGSNPRTYMS